MERLTAAWRWLFRMDDRSWLSTIVGCCAYVSVGVALWTLVLLASGGRGR